MGMPVPRWIAGLGVAGLFVLLFFEFLSGWKFSFGALSSVESFVVALAVLLTICFIAWLVFRPAKEERSVYSAVDRLRIGLSSPEDNIKQVEMIANSDDPKKTEYLRALSASTELSFAEREACRLAIFDIEQSRTVRNLKDRVRDEEFKNVRSKAEIVDDPLERAVYMGLQYWRYVNRPSHPDYQDTQKLLAMVAMHHGFTPEAHELRLKILAKSAA